MTKKRVLLKLSGEVLMGDQKFGLEAKKDALRRFNQEINFPDILRLMECYSFD